MSNSFDGRHDDRDRGRHDNDRSNNRDAGGYSRQGRRDDRRGQWNRGGQGRDSGHGYRGNGYRDRRDGDERRDGRRDYGSGDRRFSGGRDGDRRYGQDDRRRDDRRRDDRTEGQRRWSNRDQQPGRSFDRPRRDWNRDDRDERRDDRGRRSFDRDDRGGRGRYEDRRSDGRGFDGQRRDRGGDGRGTRDDRGGRQFNREQERSDRRRHDGPRRDWSRDDRDERPSDRPYRDAHREDRGYRRGDDQGWAKREDRGERHDGERREGARSPEFGPRRDRDDWGRDRDRRDNRGDRRGSDRSGRDPWREQRRDGRGEGRYDRRGDRDRRDQWRRPRDGDDRRQGGRAEHDSWDHRREAERPLPPGLAPADNEPQLPEGYDESQLPAGVRAELKGVSKLAATKIGGHLQAAGELIDIDPDLALRHVMVARRLGSRLPVVREVAAEVAYAAGAFDTALTEYRALHRMTGNDDYLPVIADCERAVGKHQNALRTLRDAKAARLSDTQRMEAVLVEAGIREDLGQRPEAARLLKQAIGANQGGLQEQARLRVAYANLLAANGQVDQAIEWLTSARKHDRGDELGIDDLLAELRGETPVPESDEFEILDVEEYREADIDEDGDILPEEPGFHGDDEDDTDEATPTAGPDGSAETPSVYPGSDAEPVAAHDEAEGDVRQIETDE